MFGGLKFLMVVALLAGVGFAAMWVLAHNAPEPTEVVKPINNDKL